MTALLVGMSAGVDSGALGELAAGAGIGCAFLQVHDPALVDVLTGLADDGAASVLLIGAGWASPGPKRSWLRRVAAHWLRERAAAGAAVPELRLSPTLLPTPDGGLLAAAVEAGGGVIDDGAAPLRCAAWESVPRHRHQVLVCRGPRCSARGAAGTATALGAELKRRGLGDDDVLVTVTGCQYPCNHAPVVSVQPDDIWYGGLSGAAVPRLVAEHLVEGKPLADLRLGRGGAE